METGMTGGLVDDSIPGHPHTVFRSAWACAREGE